MGKLNARKVAALDVRGVEKSRERVLTEDEIATVFRVFRENNVSFTRENYLSSLLLISSARRQK